MRARCLPGPARELALTLALALALSLLAALALPAHAQWTGGRPDWDPRALADLSVHPLPHHHGTHAARPAVPLRFAVRLSRAVAAPVTVSWQAEPTHPALKRMAQSGARRWPSGEVTVAPGTLEAVVELEGLPGARAAAVAPVQVVLNRLRGPALPAAMVATLERTPAAPPPQARPIPPTPAQRASEALAAARRIDELAGPATTPEGLAAREILAQSQAELARAMIDRRANEATQLDLEALRQAWQSLQRALGVTTPGGAAR